MLTTKDGQPHQRRLWLCQHPAQAAGRGEARRPVRHIRPEGPHLPPPGLRGLQGAAEGDARRAGRPASRAQGCAGRHEYPPLRAGRLGGRRSDRHHRRQGYRRRVGNRDRHRRQGLTPAGHGQHPGQAGVHPYGTDYYEGDDPGDLSGGLRLRPRPHRGLEGADGGTPATTFQASRALGKRRPWT